MSLKGDAAKSLAEETIFTELRKAEELNKEELLHEVKQWRALWDYIPADMQGLLSQVGREVYVFKRDGDSFQGHFASFDVAIKSQTFKTTERLRDNVNKKFFIFTTESTIPISNIVDMKFVTGQYEDTPDPYAIPQTT